MMEGHKEHMGRKLPVVDIAGVEFYVDAEQGLLIDTANNANTISKQEMLWTDDHLEFLFDKQARNISPGSWNEREHGRHEYVWLRYLEYYDPEGATKLLGLHRPQLPQTLPVINIEGTAFVWYAKDTLLMQQANPWNVITKSDMQRYDEGVGFYFDTNRKVVPFPHELEQLRAAGKLPAHVRFVHQRDIVQKINEQEQLKQTPRKGYKIR